MTSLLFVSLFMLGIGLALLWLAGRARRASGLPPGEIVYSDTGALETVDKPLVSRRFGLVGKPDYLVRTERGGVNVTVPVEVKSRAAPPSPYASHVLQLGAYCLLVEDAFNARPPHGLLRYADSTFEIPFTDDLRREVLQTAHAIRSARAAATIHRQHDESVRCRACGYQAECGDEMLEWGLGA